MKLVDILARDLKAWPSQEDVIYQDIFGYLRTPSTGIYSQHQLAEDRDSQDVTRWQWQAAVDALKATEVDKAVEWDGEGLPPVGTDQHIEPDNRLVRILAHGVSGDVVVAICQDGKQITFAISKAFRTAEQIKAEDKQDAWLAGIAAQYDQETADKCAAILVEGGYRKQAPSVTILKGTV